MMSILNDIVNEAENLNLTVSAAVQLSVSYLDIGRPKLSARYKGDYILDLASGVRGMFPTDAIEAPKEVSILKRSHSAL